MEGHPDRGDSVRGVAVVTGASSGIGAATARALARAGFAVVLGARRVDRLQQVAADVGGVAVPLDVTRGDSVSAFVKQVPDVQVLVNNAGGAFGRDPIEKATDEDWLAMYQVNVMGTVRMTRALLPALERSGLGHIVVVGSVAGFETYWGGAGYTGAKHAVRALTRTLRLELLGRPIRVTEIDPGLVETEFSLVRFRGDQEEARAPYRGMTPLTADDVAECIRWAVTRPGHVNVDEIVVRPLDQATASDVVRRGE